MNAIVVPGFTRRRYSATISSSNACRNAFRSSSLAEAQFLPSTYLALAGTSKAQESSCRHRSLASTSDPESKNDIEALLTFSTNARTASFDCAVANWLAIRKAKPAKRAAKLRLIRTSMALPIDRSQDLRRHHTLPD